MVILIKKTFITYVLHRLPSKCNWTKKKIIFHGSFYKFRPKIEGAVKVKNDEETL